MWFDCEFYLVLWSSAYSSLVKFWKIIWWIYLLLRCSMLKLYGCYCCVLLVEWIFSLSCALVAAFFLLGCKIPIHLYKFHLCWQSFDHCISWIIGGIVANVFKFWEVVISPFSCFQVGSMGAEGFCVNIPWSQGGVGDNDYIFAFQHVVLPIG